MPQLRAILNAFLGITRRRPGARLDPGAFLAHAVDLARHSPPPPPGLVESLESGGYFAAQLRSFGAPYVACYGPAGRLAPHALERIAAAFAANPQALALYTDEIATDARGRPAEVRLKPAFDPVLLESLDYFGPLVAARRDWLQAGAGRPLRELALCAPPGTILHLPYPAYIGPVRPRHFTPAPPAPRPWPPVSIIIPNLNAPDLIETVLAGLFQNTDYPEFNVTVIDNGSTDPRTLALYESHASPRLLVEIEPAPFNFSAAVNRGAALTEAPLLLLLNNGIEVIDPGWLKEMVACLDYPNTAIVGAKLLYPDRTLQHAGVIAGLGDYAGHWHIGRPEDEPGPLGRLGCRQSLSVVTGACMLITRASFDAVGGFDAEAFPIAYNDVDFCLRAGAHGRRVVWTPFARLIHHESATRGSDERPENRARHAREKAALQSRWRTDLLNDSAYNPWAARTHSDPWPAARAKLPDPRL